VKVLKIINIGGKVYKMKKKEGRSVVEHAVGYSTLGVLLAYMLSKLY
jgi:hypothetical protein